MTPNIPKRDIVIRNGKLNIKCLRRVGGVTVALDTDNNWVHHPTCYSCLEDCQYPVKLEFANGKTFYLHNLCLEKILVQVPKSKEEQALDKKIGDIKASGGIPVITNRWVYMAREVSVLELIKITKTQIIAKYPGNETKVRFSRNTGYVFGYSRIRIENMIDLNRLAEDNGGTWQLKKVKKPAK